MAPASVLIATHSASALDEVAPETFLDAAVDGDGAGVTNGGTSLSFSLTLAFHGTDDVGIAGFACSVDFGDDAPCVDPISVTLGAGTRSVRVSAVDTAGNVDPTPVEFAWIILLGDYGGFDWAHFGAYPPAGGELLDASASQAVLGGFRITREYAFSPAPDGSCPIPVVEFPMTVEVETVYEHYGRNQVPDPHAVVTITDGSMTTCGDSVLFDIVGVTEGYHAYLLHLVEPSGDVEFGSWSFFPSGGYAFDSPSVYVPESITQNATSPAGATVTWIATSQISDQEFPNPPVTCVPASGSLFPVGLTSVTCEAYYFALRGWNTINVTVLASAADSMAPETFVDSAIDGENDPVAQGNGTLSHSLTLAFHGTDAVGVVRYACSLDNATFVGCTSPTTFNVVANSSHQIRVRASDAANNTDATPASFTWTVQTPAQAINESIAYVEDLFLVKGAASSLVTLLEQAQSRLVSGTLKDTTTACTKLATFVRLVEADRRAHILTDAQAATMTSDANDERAALGCA